MVWPHGTHSPAARLPVHTSSVGAVALLQVACLQGGRTGFLRASGVASKRPWVSCLLLTVSVEMDVASFLQRPTGQRKSQGQSRKKEHSPEVRSLSHLSK